MNVREFNRRRAIQSGLIHLVLVTSLIASTFLLFWFIDIKDEIGLLVVAGILLLLFMICMLLWSAFRFRRYGPVYFVSQNLWDLRPEGDALNINYRKMWVRIYVWQIRNVQEIRFDGWEFFGTECYRIILKDGQKITMPIADTEKGMKEYLEKNDLTVEYVVLDEG